MKIHFPKFTNFSRLFTYVFLGFILILINNQSKASHIVGGDLTYQCVSTTPGIYYVEYKWYRDCQGIPMCGCGAYGPLDPACTIDIDIIAANGNCAGQSFPKQKLTVVPNTSAYDVIQLCAMSTTVCNNCGTRTPGSFTPGIEIFTFRGTINLASLTSDPTCCLFNIGFSDCCRNAAITTFLNPSGLSFYSGGTLNKCMAPCNSAPAFTNDPVAITCAGQEFTYNLGAIDPDGDSLSYAFGQSQTSAGVSVPYASPYTANTPFPVRGLTSSSLTTQCDPLLPVSGFCLDPITGDLRFFPTNAFVANLVVEVKQWKYVNGVATLAGVTRRDIQFHSVTCATNNPPVIKTYDPKTGLPVTGNKFYTCANKELCLIIAAADDTKGWDTTDLKWNNPVTMTSTGATFKPLYNVAQRSVQGPKRDSFLFCWTPPADKATSLPHYFIVTAKDRMCPVSAWSSKSFGITVGKIPQAVINKVDKGCGKYEFSFAITNNMTLNNTYTQILVETAPGSDTYTTYSGTLPTTSPPPMVPGAGTFIKHSFNKSGWHKVRLRLTNVAPIGQDCPNDRIVDSVYIPELIKTSILDTFNCYGVPVKVTGRTKGGTPLVGSPGYYNYKFYMGDLTSQTLISKNVPSPGGSLSDSNAYLNPIDIINPTRYKVVVIDKNGCRDSLTFSVKTNVLPKRELSSSIKICPGSKDSLNAGDSDKSVRSWKWFKSPNFPKLKDSLSQYLTPIDSGRYYVRKTDTLGCTQIDSIDVTFNKFIPIFAGENVCLKDANFTLKKMNNFTFDSIHWYKLPLDLNSSILSKSDSIQVSPDTTTSYILRAFQTNNGITCQNQDTVIVFKNALIPNASINAISSTKFCQGGNNGVLLNSVYSSGNNYQWRINGVNITGANLYNYFAKNSGMYSVKVINQVTNCLDSSNSIEITALQLPSSKVTITGNSTICNGDSVILNAPIQNSYNYQWRKNGTNISLATFNRLSISSTGTFDLIVIDSNNCKSVSDSIKVLVNPKPIANFTLIGQPNFCEGKNTILSASNLSGYNFQWFKNGYILKDSIKSNLTINSTGIYNLVLSNSYNCFDTSTSLSIKVNPLPNSEITNQNLSSLCDGDTLVLNSKYNLGNSYQWFKDGVSILGEIKPYFIAFKTGLYSFLVTDTNSCSSTSNKILLKFNTLPIINAGNDFSICKGDSIKISGIGALDYTWNNGVKDNKYFIPSITKLYVLKGTDSNGCSNFDTLKLTVNNNPNSIITTNTQNIICLGDSVNLYANVGAKFQYIWKKNNSLLNGENSNLLIVKSTGNYSLTVIDSNNCSANSDSIRVLVNQNPYVQFNISNSLSFCQGNSVTLTGNSNNNYSYQWFKNSTPIYGAVSFQQTFNSTGIYSVIVTDQNNCTLKKDFNISSNSLPLKQQIVGNPSIVPFLPYLYIVNSNQGINYNWVVQNGVIQSGQGTNGVNVIWAGKGPYSITLIQTNSFNCSDTTTLLVINSNCNFPVTINSFYNKKNCVGDSVLLVAQWNNTFTNIQWFRNGQLILNQNKDSLWIFSTGNYQAQLTSNSCTNISNNYYVDFNLPPLAPIINKIGNMGSCVSPKVILFATGGPYSSFNWSNGSTSDTMITSKSGTYYVTVKDSNGCYAKSNNYQLNISTLPVFPICIVTVDSASGHNIIVWEKSNLNGVDSFYIFKESNQINIYNKIGSLGKSQFSTFVDSNSNANQQAYKYKIAVLDTCGNITLMSDFHKTIHLTINQGLSGVLNLIWSHYEGFNFNSYNIYRGNSTNNIQLLASISSGNNSFTDLAPNSGINYYLVEAVNQNPCIPSAKSNIYNSTISNIVSLISTGNSEINLNETNILVYPNPSSGHFNLNSSTILNAEVLDVLGKKIISLFNVREIDLSNQNSGIYMLRLLDKNGNLVKVIKLIKK